MRPMCWVFSRPINFHVMPPSVDLNTPPPGSIVLRVFGSPVPAQTMFVSVGAMASTPIEITDLSSKTGRHVTPLFVVFQIPPAAAATNTVLDGPGIPTTSDSRPMKFAGPTVRHLKPATVDESSVCADARRAEQSSAHAAESDSRRRRSIDICAMGLGVSRALTVQTCEVAEEG